MEYVTIDDGELAAEDENRKRSRLASETAGSGR